MYFDVFKYWAIAGFILLFSEFLTSNKYLKNILLTVAGAMFFTAVIAYKYPKLYIAQIIVFVVMIPIIYLALHPYVKNKKTRLKK